MTKPLSHNGLIILKVRASDPRETYAGLLWIQEHKGYRNGWVAQKFRAIFGKWPKPKSKVEPVPPNNDLREYLAIMNSRFRAKKKREEAKVGELKTKGLLPSFMTLEDWEVKL